MFVYATMNDTLTATCAQWPTKAMQLHQTTSHLIDFLAIGCLSTSLVLGY